MQIPAKLLPLVQKKKRFKIPIGGRGSGKSQSVHDICAFDMAANGMKIGFFREFMNSMEDSVYSLLEDEIKRLEIDGFSLTKTTMTHVSGGEARFRGLARNPTGIKSMHGFNRFVVEEAQTISEESLQLLTPTLREPDSEIWLIANPQSRADPFSQRFIVPFERELERDGYYEDDLHLIIVCNYTDNPFFPDVLEQERQFDEQNLSKAEYDHIWLGKFMDQIDGSIIRPEWFDAAVDAHIKLGIEPVGQRVVTHDPSDLGDDNKALVLRHGILIEDAQERETGDVNEGCDWATDYAIQNGADVFRWDGDGLGATLRRQISEALFPATGIKLDMFRGSNTPDNPDDVYQPDQSIERSNVKTNRQTFKNKRAQYYWALRDKFYATYRAVVLGFASNDEQLISISSAIKLLPLLRSEVCRIPKKYNPNGLIQIMSKQDMWQTHKIKSPNLADALMMSENIGRQSVDGSYFGVQIEQARITKRIVSVPYDPAMPVHVFWEIGQSDHVAIWFYQERGSDRRLIDYYDAIGESITHFAAMIKDTKYLIGVHYVPYDDAREDQKIGKRVIDSMEAVGIRPIIRVNRAKSQEDLLAWIFNARTFIQTCSIDEEKCATGIIALDNFRKEWDDNRKAFKKTPVKNWAISGAMALCVGVMGTKNRGSYTGGFIMPVATADY